MGSLAIKMKAISNVTSVYMVLLLYFIYLNNSTPLLSYEAQTSSKRPPISVGLNITESSPFGGTGVIIPPSSNIQCPNSRPCKDLSSKCCKPYKTSRGFLKCPAHDIVLQNV